MSIHSSLRALGGKTGAFRNVLKRHERLRALITQGRWAEGQSVLGLPKQGNCSKNKIILQFTS